MKRSLAGKLILAFTLIAVTTAALVAVTIWLTSPTRLGDLVAKQQLSTFKNYLINYYQTNGTLSGIEQSFPRVDGPVIGSNSIPSDLNFTLDQRFSFVVIDANNRVVLAHRPDYLLGMMVSSDKLVEATPIEVDGTVVGYIITQSGRPGFTEEEQNYLKQMYRAVALAAGGAVLLSLIVGALLASSLTRPLRELKQATQRMAGGELEQQVKIRTKDEIGDLGQTFNQMSHQLARSNQLRRQMTADIAHDLRTPLTVIAGYIESMRDGVLSPTKQRLNVIYAEITRLQRLVEDLRMLSRVEAGELALSRQLMPIERLLRQTAAAFQHQAEQHGVQLIVQSAEDLPDISIDEMRMLQVMGNLMTNALRYTPDGGIVTLISQRDGNWAVVKVKDTGSGISPEDLPRVFDRFYRGDASRSEQNGESGLGLAIARALVQAHAGEIVVESQPGQGTTFIMRLPLPIPAENSKV
jgi:signal transduction histidine kinase